MIFYLIGIDYKRLPPDIRENAYRNKDSIDRYWKSVSPGKAAILITCNRIEIYGFADSLEEAEYLQKRFRYLFPDTFKNAYLINGGKDIFEHGVKLACGLESQLKGESQIIRQLEEWMNKENFPIFLVDIWTDIIETAKYIRVKSGLVESDINIANVVFNDIKHRIKKKSVIDVTVIGTGKVAGIIAENRLPLIQLSFISGKNHTKAKRLAQLAGGKALLSKDIPKQLIDTDVVISATSSPHYALSISHFKGAIRVRKRLLYIYDLAVPCDVEPGVMDLNFNVLPNPGQIISDFILSNEYLKRSIKSATKLVMESISKYRRKYEDTNRCATKQTCYYTS